LPPPPPPPQAVSISKNEQLNKRVWRMKEA